MNLLPRTIFGFFSKSFNIHTRTHKLGTTLHRHFVSYKINVNDHVGTTSSTNTSSSLMREM